MGINEFIDDDVKRFFLENKKKYDQQRGKPTEEQLNEAIAKTKKEFSEHYKKQQKKHKNLREFYKDSLGGDIILVMIPNQNATEFNKQDGSTGHLHFGDCPLVKDDITIFFDPSTHPLDKETVYLLRGKITINYKDLNDNNDKYGSKLDIYLQKKGAESLDDIDINDYIRKFTFNLWDIISRGN